MACEINITYKNEKINKKALGSEEELDDFLKKNRMILEKRLGSERAKIFSFTPPENSVESIKHIVEKTKNLISQVAWTQKHIATTSLWKVVGKIGDINSPIKSYPNSTIDFEQQKKDRKNGILIPTDMGNTIEALTYSGLFNKPVDNYGIKRNTMNGLSDSFINTAQENGKKLREWIINKYFWKTKNDSNFDDLFQRRVLTQLGVATSDYNSNLKDVIKNNTFDGKSGQNIDTIYGIADLVVVDDDGVVHTFDIKTTGMEDTSSFNISQFTQNHDDYVAQVTVYSGIIQQGAEDSSGHKQQLPVGRPGLIVLPYNKTIDPVENVYKNSGLINDVFDPTKNIYEIPESNRYFNSVRDYFWSSPTITDDTMEKVSKFGKENFPNSRVSEQVKANQATLEFYEKSIVHNIPKDTSNKELKLALAKGHNWYFVEKYKNGTYKYQTAATKEELVKNEYDADGNIIKTSPLQKYINTINANKAMTFNNFSESLAAVMTSRNISELESLLRAISPGNVHRLLHTFKRFVSNGWKFKANPSANSNGILIFEKGNNIEIVVIDTNDVTYKSKLALGKSIAGNYAHDSHLTDNRVILENIYGNQMLMKACTLLAVDPSITSGKKVLQISAMNLHQAYVFTETGYKLIQSYNMLAREHNKNSEDKMRLLGYTVFREDTEALVEIANEYLAAIDPTLKISGESTRRQFKTLEEEILSRIRRLKRENVELYDIRDKGYGNSKWDAFAYLSRALLSAKNLYISQEKDLGKIFNGMSLTGIDATSFNSSTSPLARQLGELTSRFFMEARMKFVDEQFEWSKALAEAEEEAGWSGTTGNEWSFFKNWFLLDSDGNIDPKFRIRPIDQIRGTKNQAAAKLFLELIAKHRWPNYTEEDIENAKNDGSYYDVPIMKANTLEQIWNGNGFRDTVKTAWKRLKTMGNQLLNGKEISERTRQEFEKIDLAKVPDMMWEDSAERIEKLEEPGSPRYHGPKACEQNLDFLLLTAIASGIKSEVSEHYMPIYTSVMVVIDYMTKMQGFDIGNIQEAVEKYIRSKVFDRDIRDFENKPIAAALGLLKAFTANVALAWNTRGLFRESLGGIKKHFNRFASGIENKIDGYGVENIVTADSFEEAYVDVLGNTTENMGIFSLYNQLNSITGMVNFSYDEMANQSKLHQWTVLGIVGDKKMCTATAPDYLHRMAILGGHLRTIGAWKAYSLDENGKLKYDMTKDERFQTWFKYKDNEESIPAKDLPTYIKEKQVYENELNDWKQMSEYSHLKYGDMLPQALSNQHLLGIKTYADLLYGNYDSETQAIIQRQTLGSLYFQYKTYGLAQAAQWFSESRNTNEGLSLHFITNDKGEKIVKVPPRNQEEFQQYGEWIEKPESEVTEEEWRRGATYLTQLGGLVTEGRLGTDLAMMGHLLSLDTKGFMELWNTNPLYRSNLILSLLDLFEFLIIGLICNLLYKGEGKEPIYKQSFINRWTYGVVMGAAEDGPLWQTFKGIFGDGTPPVLGMLQNYVKTTNSVISGNTNALYAITNTFGMTRELSNLFKKELQNI